MDELTGLEGTDPVDHGAVERALSHPGFDELFDRIVSDSTEDLAEPAVASRLRSRRSRRPRRRWRTPIGAAAAAAVLLGVLAGVGVIGGGGGGLSRPVATAWKAARPFVQTGSAAAGTRRGTWRLVDALLTGTWQQNVYGPPGGSFSCSPDGACYVLAGKYPSATAGAPLLSESLYVTTDDGATWTELPVPSGLVPTTPLECSGPLWCAMGATYDGQPVLAATRDGGHSFTVDPLPAGVAVLRRLSCPSTGSCLALASTSLETEAPVDATLLVTDDGGSTFRDEPILSGDSMVDLACSSRTDCTAVGMTDASGHERVPVGVAAVTSDQGRTWTAGSLPAGFGVKFSQLACPDAHHCFLAGSVPVANRNLAGCGSSTDHPGSTPLPAMSPQVEAISEMEANLAHAAALKEYETTHAISCSSNPFTTLSDVASSSNGGLSWTPQVLPADVPGPQLDALACPTATECWAGGQEEVAQRTPGGGVDMGSAVLVGTTDGGSTWSKVVFSVPATAPNPAGQSYQTIGSVSCPDADVCLARGVVVQGSPYAPVYSLVVPGG